MRQLVLFAMVPMAAIAAMAQKKVQEPPREPVRVFVTATSTEAAPGEFKSLQGSDNEKIPYSVDDVRKYFFGEGNKEWVAKLQMPLVETRQAADVVVEVVFRGLTETSAYEQVPTLTSKKTVHAKVTTVRITLIVGDHRETFEGHGDSAGFDRMATLEWLAAADRAGEQAVRWIDMNRAQILAQRKAD